MTILQAGQITPKIRICNGSEVADAFAPPNNRPVLPAFFADKSKKQIVTERATVAPAFYSDSNGKLLPRALLTWGEAQQLPTNKHAQPHFTHRHPVRQFPVIRQVAATVAGAADRAEHVANQLLLRYSRTR